jgi:hypothetical protein
MLRFYLMVSRYWSYTLFFQRTISDFTWGGRFVCLFLCVIGIALYAIPTGTLFESFGAVLGLAGDDDEDEADNGDDKISKEADNDNNGKSAGAEI